LSYPTLRCIALNYLACQALSVPCEHLFLAGGDIATKRQARLGATRFEELQMMKFAWRKDIDDIAALNSSQIEDIEDEIMQYKDMLVADQEFDHWDKSANEFHIE
jgi:hypothetical protein